MDANGPRGAADLPPIPATVTPAMAQHIAGAAH